MQDRTYGDLYKLIQSLAGVKNFAPSEEDDIANFINRRFKTAYDASQAWSRYLVVGEERPASSFVLRGVKQNSAGEGFRGPYTGAYENLGNDSNGNAVYFPMFYDEENPHVIYKDVSTASEPKWACAVIYSRPAIDPTTKVVSFSTAPVPFPFYQANSSSAGDQRDPVDHDYPWQVKVWKINESLIDNKTYPVLEQKTTIPYKTTYFNSVEDSTTGLAPRPEMGEIIRIHRTQPFNRMSAEEFSFYNDDLGATLLNPTPTTSGSYFVTYKKPFEPFTISINYTTSLIKFPEEFFSYVAHAVYADFLTMDGQTSKAVIESDRADELLNLQLERIDIISNNQHPNNKFSTYINKQSR